LLREFPSLQLIEGNMDRLSEVKDFIISLRPDIILHLAWNGIDAAARNSPSQLIDNVQGTLELLDLCRLANCPVFVGFGSQAEYGTATGTLHENSPCNPSTAYGVAKHALSELTIKFGEITSTRVLWFRLFSAYGPHDHPNHLLPVLIKSLLAGVCPPLTAGKNLAALYVGMQIDSSGGI
jgi:nucleoside-diphosphate-sugar epimerase